MFYCFWTNPKDGRDWFACAGELERAYLVLLDYIVEVMGDDYDFPARESVSFAKGITVKVGFLEV